MPVVAAVACPHTPQLLVRPETEDRDLVLRVHAAYAKVRQLLTDVRADVICLIGGDHIEGFFLNAVPAFAVYTGASVSGQFGRYTYTFAVHEEVEKEESGETKEAIIKHIKTDQDRRAAEAAMREMHTLLERYAEGLNRRYPA